MKRCDAPDWIRQLDDLYDRAIARSDRLCDYWRDFAFLGLEEELIISGDPATRLQRTVRVRQLTLQMFIELCAVRSPFLVGGPLRPEHVVQILWRLSPEYQINQAARQDFIARILELPFRPAVRSISRYLDRMLIDKPPSSDKPSDGRSDTSFAASLVHEFASLYGWSDHTILNLPMPALFQYLRRIQRHHNPDAIAFYPLRDRITQKIFRKYTERKKLHEQHQGQH